MQLIKWDPRVEFDRFFEEFPTLSFPKINNDLAVDVYEKNGNLIARMNIPGVDPEKIDISTEDDILRISGSHEEEKEKEGKNYYRKEIKSGSFFRSVLLPKNIDSEHVKAEYKDGVLQVTMPVAKEQKKSNIKVVVKK